MITMGISGKLFAICVILSVLACTNGLASLGGARGFGKRDFSEEKDTAAAAAAESSMEQQLDDSELPNEDTLYDGVGKRGGLGFGGARGFGKRTFQLGGARGFGKRGLEGFAGARGFGKRFVLDDDMQTAEDFSKRSGSNLAGKRLTLQGARGFGK